MLDYQKHSEMHRFVRELNNLYISSPELWEIDDSWDGFRWIDADRANDNVVIYERTDASGSNFTVLVHFSPVYRENYEFPVQRPGKYEIIFDSDLQKFGGGNSLCGQKLCTLGYDERNPENSENSNIIRFNLPGYCGLILKRSE